MYPDHIQKLIDEPREFLTAEQITKVVGKDPATLRYMARNMPDRLPFPCIAAPGHRNVRFPKWPFLNAFGYSRSGEMKEAPVTGNRLEKNKMAVSRQTKEGKNMSKAFSIFETSKQIVAARNERLHELDRLFWADHGGAWRKTLTPYEQVIIADWDERYAPETCRFYEALAASAAFGPPRDGRGLAACAATG